MLTARIPDVTVEETIDALYALPAERFTQARNDAASELRGKGRREDAERVKALRKPTAAAAAVNRVVREQRRETERFLRAAAELRDAQFAGKGDVAAATKGQREALERLIRAGGEEVRQSLLAAAVDDDAAAELLEGRLERELEPRGFGTLLSHARPQPPPPAKQRPDDRAARARLQDAKTALSSAESEEREARRRWERSQRELEQAQAAVQDAQDELERLRRS
jgi:hypothetical protein